MSYGWFFTLYFILNISTVNENSFLSLEKLQKNDKILLLYIVNQE